MEILEARYLISSPNFGGCPRPDRPEFAFIGRSNVGKSSLINMLCNHKGLAKTSAQPGKTQLINHFEIKDDSRRRWYIVDLPGYGYAKVSQRDRNRWEEMIRDYIRKRENLRQLFVLVDSRHTPQTIDLEFINRLGEWQIPFSIVFTKADKNKPGATQRNVQAFQQALLLTWESLPPCFLTSAISQMGRAEMLRFLDELNREKGVRNL